MEYKVSVENKTVVISVVNVTDKARLVSPTAYSLSLYSYQKHVESHYPVNPPGFCCSKVAYHDSYELDAGQTAIHTIDLEVTFGPLSSGRYYLRMVSKIGGKALPDVAFTC